MQQREAEREAKGGGSAGERGGGSCQRGKVCLVLSGRGAGQVEECRYDRGVDRH